jgi:RNA polymerase sigma-70 factor, ECF subfamily
MGAGGRGMSAGQPEATRGDDQRLAVGRRDPDDLLSHWRPLLDQASRLMLGNASDAQDLVQDTYERAVRALGQYRPGTNMRAWLFTIMARRARDHFRRERGRTTEPFGQDLPAAPDADAASPWTLITEEQLRAALGKLAPPFRQVFELHELEHVPYVEIALRIGLPINTVASRLRRAREKLRDLLCDALERRD